MAEKLARKIKPDSRVRLADYPTDADGGLDKEEGVAQLVPLREEVLEHHARTHRVPHAFAHHAVEDLHGASIDLALP